MKRAVIFDMDGVLVDSEPLHTVAFQHILAEEGMKYSEEEITQDGLGRTFSSHMGELILRFGLPNPLEYYSTRFVREVLRLLTDKAEPSSGASEVLTGLRTRGLKLGLASSSSDPIVWGTLRILGFESSFDAVVSGDAVIHSKPHPEIFLIAAEKLGVEPSDCIVVEDSPRGVESGKRAGMTVVAVQTDMVSLSDIATADYIIESLTEFPYSLV